jgi:FkbM family methyltransferase
MEENRRTKTSTVERHGTKYGGFYYPSDLPGLDSNSVVYCVGAGEDITHDVILAKKLGCKVFIFDPTPRAIKHVEHVKKVFAGEEEPVDSSTYGGGDPSYWKILLDNKVDPSKIELFHYGLYTKNSIIKFFKPTNNNHVSHSVVPGMRGNVNSQNYIFVAVKELRTIMRELGHDHIDLLKIDIEGCECDVIQKMLEDDIKPKYISVDFDLGWHGDCIRDRQRCESTIRSLKEAGYVLIHSDMSDFSFMLAA